MRIGGNKNEVLHLGNGSKFTLQDRENLNKNTTARHTHENKEALDNITTDDITALQKIKKIDDAPTKDSESLVYSGGVYDFIMSKIGAVKSLSYFFANNYNNELYGIADTKNVLIADYIFKQNSIPDICIDLSSCYSLIGGFLNSEVESVTFENGTPKLTKAQNLFRGCKNLKSINGLDTSNVDSCKYMFYGCESIENLRNELVLNGDCSYMFYGCSALTSATLDCRNVTNATGMFTGCSSLLYTLNLNGLTVSVDISDCQLDNAAMVGFANSLGQASEGATIITSDNWTDDWVPIATGKGWTIR